MSQYPRPNYHFTVQWGGTRLGVMEVSGLEAEIVVIEHREGGDPEATPRKMPGMRKFGNIVLKRGLVAGDNEFFEWFNSTQLSTAQRRDIVINLLNENHEPVIVWKVKNAWPVKLQSADLKSDANEVAIETLELAHEGLVIEAV